MQLIQSYFLSRWREMANSALLLASGPHLSNVNSGPRQRRALTLLISRQRLVICLMALSAPLIAQNSRELKRERSQTVRKLVVLAFEVQQQKIAGQDLWTKRLVDQLDKALKILQPKLPKPYLDRLRSSFDRLTKAVAQSDSREVVEATQFFLNEVDQIFKLDRAPAQTPDPLIGEAVFKARCQLCHGEKGEAGTKTSSILTLKPLSWQNPSVAQHLTPFIVFNILLSGIDESPKPAFRNKLSSHELWSVAFWIMRLTLSPQDQKSYSAKEVEEAAKSFPKTISIGDLAMTANSALMQKIWQSSVPQLDEQKTLQFARFQAPFDAFRER